MYTYFFDEDYFNFLITQLYNNWTCLYPAILEDINPNCQRQILLHCPYGFLPDSYTNNKFFMKEWIQRNHDKHISINDGESYIFKTIANFSDIEDSDDEGNSDDDNEENYEPGKQLLSTTGNIYSSYCRVGGDIIGVKKNVVYLDGVIQEESSSVDGLNEGMNRGWEDGYLFSEVEFQHGKLNGQCRQWYKISLTNGKHQLEETGLYIDDRKQGLWTTWYTNGNINNKRYYRNGELDGEYKQWFRNGDLELDGNYVLGTRQGLWTEWNLHNSIKETSMYKNGRKYGYE